MQKRSKREPGKRIRKDKENEEEAKFKGSRVKQRQEEKAEKGNIEGLLGVTSMVVLIFC